MSAQKINNADKGRRVIISGGGSGGHVFPAIAIANQLKELDDNIEILFVGATGKIEMQKVPKAGYRIVGLPIRGLQRRLTWKNLSVPFRLISSLWKARKLIKDFKPHVAVGVGGYASFPVLRQAAASNIPVLIQEQNQYAGVANRLLKNKADLFCVAYDGMENVFPENKIVQTGNPVRLELKNPAESKAEAQEHFGLKKGNKTIVVIGGSLGARTLNQAMAANADAISGSAEVNWLWQAGSLYVDDFKSSETANLPNVKMQAFIDRMDLAYEMADLIICRAGALTISEICLLGKAAILVPSPNVTEDHQTKNAKALMDKEAASLVKDSEAMELLVKKGLNLLNDDAKIKRLEKNALALARPDATMKIAKQILKLIDPNGD